MSYLKLSQNYRDISSLCIANPTRKIHLSFYSSTSVSAFYPELLHKRIHTERFYLYERLETSIQNTLAEAEHSNKNLIKIT